MDYVKTIKRHGIKMIYIANNLGMSESLLRYYLGQKIIDPEIGSKIVAVLDKHIKGLTKDIQKPS